MEVRFGEVVLIGGSGLCFSVALTSDGSLYTWGENRFGQLGVGDYIDRNSPQRVPLENVTKIRCGGSFCFAVSQGELYCWGRNMNGELGLGHNQDLCEPFKFNGLEGISDICCGVQHVIARTDDDSLYSWGNNRCGQLGSGDTTSTNTPRRIDIERIVSFDCAFSDHTVAVDADSNFYVWGFNRLGQLGLGHRDSVLAPVVNYSLSDRVIDFRTGHLHTLCLWDDGTVTLSGSVNRNINVVPEIVCFSKRIESIYSGGSYCFVRDDGGDFYFWGENYYQLFDKRSDYEKDLVTYALPKKKTFQESVVSLFCSGYHAFAFVDSEVPHFIGWGNNENGQLGLGHNDMVVTPQWISHFQQPVDINHITFLTLLHQQTSILKEHDRDYNFVVNIYGTDDFEVFHVDLLELRFLELLKNKNLFIENNRPVLDIALIKSYIYFDSLPEGIDYNNLNTIESLIYCLELARNYQLRDLEYLILHKISTSVPREGLTELDNLRYLSLGEYSNILVQSDKILNSDISSVTLDSSDTNAALFISQRKFSVLVKNNEFFSKKSILILFFNYFDNLFKFNNQNMSIEIEIPFYHSQTSFSILIEYVHTGDLIDSISSQNAYEISKIIDFLDLKIEYKKYFSKILLACNNIVLDDQFIEYLKKIEYDEFFHYQHLLPQDFSRKYSLITYPHRKKFYIIEKKSK